MWNSPPAPFCFSRAGCGETSADSTIFFSRLVRRRPFLKWALERGRIRFVPPVSARNQDAASIARLDWSSCQLFWYGSLLRYASKHFRPSQFRGVCGAVALGSVIRSISSIFHRRRLRDIQVYAGIAGQAVRCMLSGRMRNQDSMEGYRQGSEVRTITNVSEERENVHIHVLQRSGFRNNRHYNSGRFIKRRLESVLASVTQIKKSSLSITLRRTARSTFSSNSKIAAASSTTTKTLDSPPLRIRQLLGRGDLALTLNPDVLLLPILFRRLSKRVRSIRNRRGLRELSHHPRHLRPSR